MTDSGLSTRLRQQSRRSGLMVGITMVFAIAICIFGAAALFAALARPFSDLIPVVAQAPDTSVQEPDTASEVDQPLAQPTAETAPSTQVPAAQPTVAPAPEDFKPTHQVTALTSVNFRTGPSVNDSVIVALSPATPLQYLDEQDTAADGGVWMKFRDKDGQEGWISEDLTGPYQP
jgi:hypothetical protein